MLTWGQVHGREGLGQCPKQYRGAGGRRDGSILHSLAYLPAAISVSQETKEDAGHHVAKKHHLESG